MSLEIKDYKTHRPIDRTDPGFTIPGFKLKWISTKVSENNPGRCWAVLRKDKMPKELLNHIEDSNPGAFAGGDTIRRGDLVLAFARKEAVDAFRKELNEQANELERSVRRAPEITGKTGKPRSAVTDNEDSDVTEEIIAKFKHDKE